MAPSPAPRRVATRRKSCRSQAPRRRLKLVAEGALPVLARVGARRRRRAGLALIRSMAARSSAGVARAPGQQRELGKRVAAAGHDVQGRQLRARAARARPEPCRASIASSAPVAARPGRAARTAIRRARAPWRTRRAASCAVSDDPGERERRDPGEPGRARPAAALPERLTVQPDEEDRGERHRVGRALRDAAGRVGEERAVGLCGEDARGTPPPAAPPGRAPPIRRLRRERRTSQQRRRAPRRRGSTRSASRAARAAPPAAAIRIATKPSAAAPMTPSASRRARPPRSASRPTRDERAAAGGVEPRGRRPARRRCRRSAGRSPAARRRRRRAARRAASSSSRSWDGPA